MPFGSICEACAFQCTVFSTTWLKCRALGYSSWSSGSTSNSCLVTDASVLRWDECLPPALVTSGAACTLLLWCQTSTWLKLRRKYKAGMCSVLLSLLEMTAPQESSSGR